MEVYDLDRMISDDVEISDDKVAELYLTNPGVWVLLEIVNQDDKGHALKLKPIKFSPNKDDLRNYVMDHDDWGESGKLIYFFTGYDGTCERIN